MAAPTPELQFNGQDLRVVLADEFGNCMQLLGEPSQDLQLVLRSACADLGGRWLVLPLRVVPA